MNQAVAERPVASEVRAEDVLRAAVSSNQGLKLHVGKIGKNIINGIENIQGTFVCFKNDDEVTGFAVRITGGIIRSYTASSQESRVAFQKWIEGADMKKFGNPNYEITPGAIAKFNSKG